MLFLVSQPEVFVFRNPGLHMPLYFSVFIWKPKMMSPFSGHFKHPQSVITIWCFVMKLAFWGNSDQIFKSYYFQWERLIYWQLKKLSWHTQGDPYLINYRLWKSHYFFVWGIFFLFVSKLHSFHKYLLISYYVPGTVLALQMWQWTKVGLGCVLTKRAFLLCRAGLQMGLGETELFFWSSSS